MNHLCVKFNQVKDKIRCFVCVREREGQTYKFRAVTSKRRKQVSSTCNNLRPRERLKSCVQTVILDSVFK